MFDKSFAEVDDTTPTARREDPLKEKLRSLATEPLSPEDRAAEISRTIGLQRPFKRAE